MNLQEEMDMRNIIEVKSIRKSFSGVSVLEDINLSLKPGEIHALLGENGAGKSTLMKILSGIYQPDSGEIFIKDKKMDRLTPRKSIEMGISTIYQELSVINELSIAENLFLGSLPLRRKFGIPIVDYEKIIEKSHAILEEVGISVSPLKLVGDLSISEKQLVEIAKSLFLKSHVVIMDEPTSSLTPKEISHLFKIMKRLKQEKKSMIYISHKLEEINDIADYVTVLRDGRISGQSKVQNISVKSLISMMVGRKIITPGIRKVKEKKESLLRIENFSRVDRKVRNVNINLHKNEILGFFGIVGSGRTELMEGLLGITPTTGNFYLGKKKYLFRNPYSLLKSGITMVTENRRETGFFPNFDIQENMSIGMSLKKSTFYGFTGFRSKKREEPECRSIKTNLKIKCNSLYQNILELSGGNQQKVILGKCLLSTPKILILDEPTRGIDVGAKAEIHELILNLSQTGIGIIVISSELPELLKICDKITVMKQGTITGVLPVENTSEKEIITLAI